MKNILVVVSIFAIFFILILVGSKQPQTRIYDCGMAEWHPDIPNKVKEECRKLHYEHWKKENDEKNRI